MLHTPTNETAASPTGSDDRLISWGEVNRLTSLSRTSVWRLSRLGRFPKPVRISAGRSAWSEAAVRSWIRARLQPTP